ncbi:MAG: superoxide dismutase [Chloroflexi bacterium]|nr:superoxide dismutase [Chloroflexota bacterium]
MRVIAISKMKSGATKEKIAALNAKELVKEWELQKADVIRQAHSRTDQVGSIFMMEVASADDAHKKLAALPLAEAGLIEFDVFPYQAYEAYGSIFGKIT